MHSSAHRTQHLQIVEQEVVRGCHEHSWLVRIEKDGLPLSDELQVKDPFTTDEKKEYQWYLEEYVLKTPFAAERAEAVVLSLRRYQRLLFNSLNLTKFIDFAQDADASLDLHLDIVGNTNRTENPLGTIHQLQWELLESADLWDSDRLRVFVRRVSLHETITPLPRDEIKENIIFQAPSISISEPGRHFNVLLVIARALTTEDTTYEDAEPTVCLSTLLGVSAKLKEDNMRLGLNVEVVRPATYQALEKHLCDSRARNGPGYFDLVHFDVHGEVKNRKGLVQKHFAILEQKADRGYSVPTAFLKLSDPNDMIDLTRVRADMIAQLLADHQIDMAVLNACESAYSSKGLHANLAETLVVAGVPNVMGMSSKIALSAAQLLLETFYNALLLEGATFSEAVAMGRRYMYKERNRPARFGLSLDLMDWFVPVTYSNGIDTKVAIEGLENSHGVETSSGETKLSNTNPNADSLYGRSFDKLRFERQFIEAGLVYLSGVAATGKTRMIASLSEEWVQTGFIDRIIHVDLARDFFMDPKAFLNQLVTGSTGSQTLDADDANFSSLVKRHLQELRLLCTIVVIDSLDFPLNGPIEAHLEQKHPKQFPLGREACMKILRELTSLTSNRAGKMFGVILIGRRSLDWLKERAPWLDAAEYKLEGLTLASAMSYSTLLLPRSTRTMSSSASDSMTHIVNMMQRLPGALKLVLQKLKIDQSVESFHEDLVTGKVAITKEDIEHPQVMFIEKRFLLGLHTQLNIDSTSRELLLSFADFWETGPMDWKSFVEQLKSLGKAFERDIANFTCLSCVHEVDGWVMTKGNQIRRIHPLFTLLLRGRICTRLEKQWRRAKRSVKRWLWPEVGEWLMPDETLINETAVHEKAGLRKTFLKAVEERVLDCELTHRLYLKDVPRFGEDLRLSFVNTLHCLSICCDDDIKLPLTEWPMQLILTFIPLSELCLSPAEQSLFEDKLERVYHVFLKRVDVVELSVEYIIFPLSIILHLWHVGFRKNLQSSRRQGLVKSGIEIVEAWEIKYGPLVKLSLFFKGKLFRYHAIDLMIDGHEPEADAWWEKMNQIDRSIWDDATDENTVSGLSIDQFELPASLSDRDRAMFEELIRNHNRQSDERLKSFVKLRGPDFWKWFKPMCKGESLDGTRADEMRAAIDKISVDLAEVHKTFLDTGVTGMDRWPQIFPKNNDAWSYVTRLNNAETRFAELEEMTDLGSWDEVQAAHQNLYQQAIDQRRGKDALVHLNEARKLAEKKTHPDPDVLKSLEAMRQLLEGTINLTSDGRQLIPLDEVEEHILPHVRSLSGDHKADSLQQIYRVMASGLSASRQEIDDQKENVRATLGVRAKLLIEVWDSHLSSLQAQRDNDLLMKEARVASILEDLEINDGVDESRGEDRREL